MQLNLPFYLSLGLTLCAIFVVAIFYNYAKLSKAALIPIFLWIIVQSVLAWIGFYQNTNTLPPRIIFVVPPIIMTMLIVFNTKAGKQTIDQMNIKRMNWVHLVRIPIELILYGLYLNEAIPKIMTFSGWNFDIVSGLIPLLTLAAFHKGKNPRKSFILTINIIGLGLLLNIIFLAIFSAPFPFQLFGFDQPNLAVLNFPFVLLPAVIVPIVLLTHLATIRAVIKNPNRVGG